MPVLALTPEPDRLAPLAATMEDNPLVVESGMSAGLGRIHGSRWPLVLLDEAFADGWALDLLERIVAAGASVALLVREPSARLILDAMERGARAVLVFPPDPETVRRLISDADEDRPARALGNGQSESLADGIVGRCAAMLEVFHTAARVAPTSAAVLLLGESGTGKELIARLIHDRSRRAAHPFVAINCAAIPDGLLESELFGHEKGAFTGAVHRMTGQFEQASGGTLFLDEIGDMGAGIQAKILRALQEREVRPVGAAAPIPVDLRLVAATNHDLEAAVAAGSFRQDLYFRLNVVSIMLPPLRRRGGDIRLLAEHFLARCAREHERNVTSISAAVLALLRAHPWPGNVRQLQNTIQRAVVLCDGHTLRPDHLPAEVRDPSSSAISSRDSSLVPLTELERRHIRRVLAETGGHMGRAAEILGIHRNTLREKMQLYGIARE